MDQSTLDKLRKLHLKSMAASYETQDSVPGIMDMTFDERLSFLVDAEMDSRFPDVMDLIQFDDLI